MLAPSAGAQTPTQDSVAFTGSGTSFSLDVDVRSGPSGENPTGQLVLINTFDGTRVPLGPPSCLAIYPDDAVSGRPTFAVVNVPAPNIVSFGDVATFEFSPSATPGLGGFEADLSFRSPIDCSPLSGFGLISGFGSLVIVDAPPLPTLKDQCKSNGWRAFGVFKNQGDCVSFIATGGKNQPSGP